MVACIGTSFLFTDKLYLYHINFHLPFIYLSVDEHLDYFYFLAVNGAINISVQIFL